LKSLDFFIYRSRYSAEVAGPVVLLLLSVMFLYSGALFPQSIPQYFSSLAEVMGQALLITLTPAFLITYLIIAQRRSVRFADRLVTSGLVTSEPAEWLRKIDTRIVVAGLLIGFLYGVLFNLPADWRNSFGGLDLQVQSLVVGQVFLWTIVGLVLTYRLHTAWRFHQTGKSVPIDLYNTKKYGPFARNGLDDVFGITMLLVLATLQSLDAQFRLANYINAWIIAFPAAASLLILPMLSLQRRLLAHKKEYLQELHRQVSEASRVVEPDSLAQIELLMQHRDRIQHTSAWPIDFSIASRLILYIVIPPLAWFGAAVVELGLEKVLSNP
jgi:hypothetical protein